MKLLKRRKLAGGCSLSAAVLITCLIAGTELPVYAAPESDGIVDVEIIHTNDIHGRSGYTQDSVFGFDMLASYAKLETPDLLIDAGDLYHGQAFATLEQGGSIAELVKAVGYDIITPGNHDWNYGKERLKELGEMSGAEILAGNITEAGNDYFGNAGIYVKEITDEDGDTVKVGVLGVFDQDITSDTAPSNIEGLDFDDDARTATELAEKLRTDEGCEIVIAVSHQQDCESFIAKTNGIDVLIAGHEHSVLDKEYPDADGNAVKVVETGSYFANIGNLSISYDMEKDLIESITETIVSASAVGKMELEADPEVTQLLSEINSRQEEQLKEVIGSTGRDLEGTWEEVRIKETGMGRLVTAAYLNETGADIAFENAGGIRIGRDLEAGDITYQDVIDTAPFGNYIVTKQITGEAVLSILEKSIELGRQNKESYDEWVATGSDQVPWPDNSGSYLQFGGMSVTYDMTKPAGERVQSVKVGTEELVKNKLYTIATNNFVSLGDDYSELKDVPELNQYAACDEAIVNFVQLGQEMVDNSTGTACLQEITSEEPGLGDQDNEDNDGSGNDDLEQGSEISGNNGNTGSGSEVNKAQSVSEQTKAAKTGDDSALGMWVLLLGISVVGIVRISVRKTMK